MSEAEVRAVAKWICDILDDLENELIVTRVRQQVLALCADHPVYTASGSEQAQVA